MTPIVPGNSSAGHWATGVSERSEPDNALIRRVRIRQTPKGEASHGELGDNQDGLRSVWQPIAAVNCTVYASNSQRNKGATYHQGSEYSHVALHGLDGGLDRNLTVTHDKCHGETATPYHLAFVTPRIESHTTMGYY